VTVADIYGFKPEVPNGFEAIDFRAAEIDDWFLGAPDEPPYVTGALKATKPGVHARLILKKISVTPSISDIYPNGYTVPEGWVEVGFREVQEGESWIGASHGVTASLVCSGFQNGDLEGRDLFRLVVRRLTPEDVYGEGYKIPAGWERVGGADFRKPTGREPYLADGARLIFFADKQLPCKELCHGYRLILRQTAPEFITQNGVKYRRVDE